MSINANRKTSLSEKEMEKFIRLYSDISYNEKDGNFYHTKNRNKAKSGDIVGWLDGNGYRIIQLGGRRYKAHRLSWFASYGRWPDKYLDHINGVKDDNRIENLREVEQSQNLQNISSKTSKNKTGFVGVYKCPTGKYYAMIMKDRKYLYLGRFASAELAHAARQKAKETFHPFAARD